MLIFHYASLETFKSIIENHCIWLCDVQKSNDSTERTYFEQTLLEIIDNFIDDPSDIKQFSPYVEKALLAFKSTYYSQRPDIPPIYSASFSLDGDLLGQWRAYAGDGTGVSIGFSRDMFNKAFHGNDGWTVEYDKSAAELACHSKIITTLQACATQFRADEKRFLNFFALTLLQFMDLKNMFYKHSQFKEEQEYRIVYRGDAPFYSRYYDNPITDTALSISNLRDIPADCGFVPSKRKYRISNNRLSSYYELSFENIREHIISEIILGPKCQTDPSDIRLFLQDNGYYSDIPIQRSEIPYR